jgi:hypothetical protein
MAERRSKNGSTNGHVSPGALLEKTIEYAGMVESQRDSVMNSMVDLQERLIELENATEGWQQLQGIGMVEGGYNEFSRAFLDHIIRQARIYWLKNPLIKRAVNVKSAYVFGQGVSIRARHPKVDEVVQAFLDDPDNRAELFSIPSYIGKEVDIECEGNIFFTFFPNVSTGRVRIRTVPTDEIRDIVRNPEDRREIWYYERAYVQQTFDLDSARIVAKPITEYYPDWRYKPADTEKPKEIAHRTVHWDSPMYHVKIGSFSAWKFGVPEVYAAIDWARAYKDELEDDATRSRALARFVFALSTKGGATAVQRARDKLSSTFATGAGMNIESNPPPVAGSTFIGGPGAELKPMDISGAVMPTDHSRPMRLMVASATGLPDTILAGDPDMGNLATAKTLDRPTELEMSTRRELWKEVLSDILNYRIDQAVLAPSGPLKGKEVASEIDGRVSIQLEDDPDTGDPMDRHIDIDFPPILEHSQGDEIHAIVEAATLSAAGNGTFAGTLPEREVSRMLLVALGANDIDEILDALEAEKELKAEQAAAEAKAAADQQAQAMKDNIALAQAKAQGQPAADPNNPEPTAPKAVAGTPATKTPVAPVRTRAVRTAEASLLEAISELRQTLAGAMVSEDVLARLIGVRAYESTNTNDDQSTDTRTEPQG